jgi:hypothetical protein
MYCVKALPSDLAVDAEAQLYWLAGLLEGEGSFVAGPPSSPRVPRIQLPMTDRDIVERAARLFDRPVWRSDRGAELGYKPCFLTALKGAAAVHLMVVLKPVMGARRRAQIERALARPHAERMRWYRRAGACSAQPCERPVRTRGLCKIHYHTWWKAKKRGRVGRHLPVDPPLPAQSGLVGPLRMPALGSDLALAWLAGLLEGEGTFEAHRERQLTYPRIALHMCDEDVVARASAHLHSRSVWPEEPRQEGWRPSYGTAITGGRAGELMSALLPHMGERRSAEIRAALSSYRPIRLSRQNVCSVSGCDQTHDARGLCKRHHMQWWRDVKRGREPRVKPLR